MKIYRNVEECIIGRSMGNLCVDYGGDRELMVRFLKCEDFWFGIEGVID